VNCIRGNGETQALRAAGGRGDRRINPNHLTPNIDQWTATVARINCRIGLQQTSESIAAMGRPLELMIRRLRFPQIQADYQSPEQNLRAAHVRIGSLSGLTPGSSI